jgi:hypothetical protein
MQLSTRATPPIMTRVRLMWAEMRGKVLDNFRLEPRRINDHKGYLAAMDERYTSDAYHSLSIEGYPVTEDLIEKVRTGELGPRRRRRRPQAKGCDGRERILARVPIGPRCGSSSAKMAKTQPKSWIESTLTGTGPSFSPRFTQASSSQKTLQVTVPISSSLLQA